MQFADKGQANVSLCIATISQSSDFGSDSLGPCVEVEWKARVSERALTFRDVKAELLSVRPLAYIASRPNSASAHCTIRPTWFSLTTTTIPSRLLYRCSPGHSPRSLPSITTLDHSPRPLPGSWILHLRRTADGLVLLQHHAYHPEHALTTKVSVGF